MKKGGKKKLKASSISFISHSIRDVNRNRWTYARITFCIQAAATIIGYEWKCEVCVRYKNRYVLWDVPIELNYY